MATISWNEKAPADANGVSLAQDFIKVPFDTEDPLILSNAAAHPWLAVKVDAERFVSPIPDFVAYPGDDRSNSLANDPEAVAEAEAEKGVVSGGVVAVEAGLNQNKQHFVGKGDTRVPITLAAADAVAPEPTQEVVTEPATDKNSRAENVPVPPTDKTEERN